MFVGVEVHWPSRVFGTCFGPRSYVVCSVCHGGLSALTLSDDPDVGNKHG